MAEFTTDEREDYSLSDSYFNNYQLVVVKNNSNVNSIDDLEGKSGGSTRELLIR